MNLKTHICMKSSIKFVKRQKRENAISKYFNKRLINKELIIISHL